jgi:hypothetical protein
MKCILHIGIEKTGTTSIQNFLFYNSDLLLSQNYKITKSLGKINNSGLIQFANENLLSSHVKKINKINDEEYDKFLKRRKNDFKNEILSTNWPLKNEKKKVLLSSEFLQSYLNTTDIFNLKSTLTDIGFNEFEIILVLRPQSEIIKSRLSTGVIAGEHYKFLINTNCIDLPKLYLKNSRLLDYGRTISNWTEVFGINNIQVFDYNKIKKNSLETNFLQAIDLELKIDDLKKITMQNTSLPFKVILALNQLNKDNKLKILNKKVFTNKVRQINSRHVDYALSEASINMLDTNYLIMNKKIEKKYMIDLSCKFKKIDYEVFHFEKELESIMNAAKESL